MYMRTHQGSGVRTEKCSNMFNNVQYNRQPRGGTGRPAAPLRDRGDCRQRANAPAVSRTVDFLAAERHNRVAALAVANISSKRGGQSAPEGHLTVAQRFIAGLE